MMDSIQLNRRANLRHLLVVLEREGVGTVDAQAQALSLKRATLKDLLAGDDITAVLAREIEWSAHRPDGWLDEDHRGQQLED